MSPSSSRYWLATFALLLFGCAATQVPPVRAQASDEGPRRELPAPLGVSPRGAPAPWDEATDGNARVAWSYGVASPVTGVSVSQDGDVYIGTREGTVHALSHGGSLRWAYTVRGAVLGAPAPDDRGRIFVASAASRITALRGDGTAYWVFRTPSPPTAPVVVSERGFVVYPAEDAHLWAVSSRAGVLWREAALGPVTVKPIAMPDGRVGVVTRGGRASLVRRVLDSRRGDELGPAEWLGAAGGESMGVVAGGKLVLLDGQLEPVAQAPARYAALTRSERYVVTPDGSHVARLNANLMPVEVIALGAQASAPPVVAAGGAVFQPCADGSVVSIQGTESRRWRVSSDPLDGALLDSAHSQLLVFSTHRVLAVRIDG